MSPVHILSAVKKTLNKYDVCLGIWSVQGFHDAGVDRFSITFPADDCLMQSLNQLPAFGTSELRQQARKRRQRSPTACKVTLPAKANDNIAKTPKPASNQHRTEIHPETRNLTTKFVKTSSKSDLKTDPNTHKKLLHNNPMVHKITPNILTNSIPKKTNPFGT